MKNMGHRDTRDDNVHHWVYSILNDHLSGTNKWINLREKLEYQEENKIIELKNNERIAIEENTSDPEIYSVDFFK